MKIRLFTSKTCVNPSIDYYIPLLFPFWGKCERSITPSYDADRFDEWLKLGNQYFELVDSLEACDIVVLPYEWRQGYKAAFDLAQQAEKYHKPFVLFFNHDSTEEIPIPNAIIFRTSLYKSKRRKNEFGLPAWSSDLGKKYLLKTKEKNDVPVIGYTGYIDYRNFWEYLIYISRYVRFPGVDQIGQRIRGICVRKLNRSPLVRTHFNLRRRFFNPKNFHERQRLEFIQCIIESDYSLVCRGGGNFSYRLYEVLSCGRIPLFIDTDCLLPYDHLIDWKSFCLWVDYKDVPKLDLIVSEFHSMISNQEFIEMQVKARQVYEEWLSPTGFYKNMWRCIPGFAPSSLI